MLNFALASILQGPITIQSSEGFILTLGHLVNIAIQPPPNPTVICCGSIKTVTVNEGIVLTPEAIIGIVSSIVATILLFIPIRSGGARFVQLILFIGILLVSGYLAYKSIAPFVNIRPTPTSRITYSHISYLNASNIGLQNLPPPPSNLSDWIQIISNSLASVESLIGIFKSLFSRPAPTIIVLKDDDRTRR